MATTSPVKKLLKTPAAKPAETATDVVLAAAEVEATPAAKPAVKTATKTAAKKAVAPAGEAVEGVVEAAAPASDDMIVKVAKEVENVKEDKAFQMIPQLLNNIDQDGFRLGGYLSKVQAEGWHMNQGHETFRAWVEAVTGIQYRKAMYLIQIYNNLVSSGISWAKVSHLGWTKLKELASILSPENVDEWVAYAESVTVLQLIEAIKAQTKGTGTSGDAPAETDKSTTTMTFKFHKDQKATVQEAIEKAMHQSGTDVPSVAIEQIALDFLGSASPLKSVMTLDEMLKSKSIEEVLGALDTVFPNVVIQAALYETAEEAAEAKAAMEAAAAAEAEGEAAPE